jgi:hypothetical protein
MSMQEGRGAGRPVRENHGKLQNSNILFQFTIPHHVLQMRYKLCTEYIGYATLFH